MNLVYVNIVSVDKIIETFVVTFLAGNVYFFFSVNSTNILEVSRSTRPLIGLETPPCSLYYPSCITF